MRQVPEYNAPPIGIVGSGRVARHLRHYFSLIGRPVRTWCRTAPLPSPPDALADCATVLVLIRDDSIVPFLDAWPALRGKRLVHCSGSLVTDAADVAHPLMTFGPALYDRATYEGIPFVTERGRPPFDELIPGLPNPSYAIRAEDRPRYHALCVMAGNFSTLLWLKLFDALQDKFGIPASAAHPYLARVAANTLADGSRALTGPLVRGDARAIAANLKALEGDPYQHLYEAFVRTYDQRS